MLILPASFQAAVLPPAPIAETAALWFAFANGQLMVRPTAQGLELPQATTWPFAKCTTKRRLYLGAWHGQPCYAAEVASNAAPPGWIFEGIRQLWSRVAEELLGIASYAAQLIEWDRNHQFCGHCGATTERRTDERGRRCPSCELIAYPRLSPVIMVRILRQDKILLVRAPRFAPGVYSLLAGFVEAGENLEQAVHREVAEEVGIKVRNLRYIASQSWPFPHSLMMGFTAEYAGGELRADGQEIVDAQWFSADDLPGLPSPMSMAWYLIQDYISAPI